MSRVHCHAKVEVTCLQTYYILMYTLLAWRKPSLSVQTLSPRLLACNKQAGQSLLDNMADAVGWLYNTTGHLRCYVIEDSGPAAGGEPGPWEFQVCTEQMAQEQPYWPATGTSDMFWDQGTFDFVAFSAHCQSRWGIKPDRSWPTTEFGGLEAMKQASNIVFSNGEFDPWSAFGIQQNLSSSVHAVMIAEGAHHLDLMFSHESDPESVRAARAFEFSMISAWIEEHGKARAERHMSVAA